MSEERFSDFDEDQPRKFSPGPNFRTPDLTELRLSQFTAPANMVGRFF